MRSLFSAICLALTLPVVAEESDFEASVSAGWDSAYILEGRDLVVGGELLSYTVETGYKNWTLGFWQAEGRGVDYSELNLWLEYGFSFGDFDFSAAYIHLWFLSDDAEDDEVAFSVSYNGLPWGIVPTFDWYRSFAAEGDYMAAALEREFSWDSGVTFTPSVQMGFNSGYIPDGHHGADNTSIQAELAIPLADNIELSAYAGYIWSIDKDAVRFADDGDLLDSFFGGVAVSYSF